MPTRRQKTRKTKTFPKAKPVKPVRRPKARIRAQGAEPITSIGPELMDVINSLVRLMRETTDPQELEQLNEQRVKLSEHAARLIDGRITETTAQYQAAVESLQQASGAIENAIQGIESVKTAILKAAKAVELAGKIAAMA